VFDRALEDAERRLVKAKEKLQKAQDTLLWSNSEIPRLEKIIQALGGKSDIRQVPVNYEMKYRNSKTGVETPVTPEKSRDVEILPDIPVVVHEDDENRFLPDV
jgi:hypothetical protein